MSIVKYTRKISKKVSFTEKLKSIMLINILFRWILLQGWGLIIVQPPRINTSDLSSQNFLLSIETDLKLNGALSSLTTNLDDRWNFLYPK